MNINFCSDIFCNYALATLLQNNKPYNKANLNNNDTTFMSAPVVYISFLMRTNNMQNNGYNDVCKILAIITE